MKLQKLIGLFILLGCINTNAQVYFPEWGDSFGSGGDEQLKRVVVDDNDNIIYSTFFMDSTSVLIGGTPNMVVTNDWDNLLIKI